MTAVLRTISGGRGRTGERPALRLRCLLGAGAGCLQGRSLELLVRATLMGLGNRFASLGGGLLGGTHCR